MKKRDLRSENRALQADKRRIFTNMKTIKTDNFLTTESMSQNEELRERNRNEVLKSRILNTEAEKPSKQFYKLAKIYKQLKPTITIAYVVRCFMYVIFPKYASEG